jgi:hypothetical protein
LSKEVVVVVFSCRHQNEFEARAMKALNWVLDNQVEPIFIFTGTECAPPEIMINAFKPDKFIREEDSKTTEENIWNTLKIAKIHWINDLKMVFVSSWYHIPRIKMLLKREGLDIPDNNFIKSTANIEAINILIEPFAYLAAKYDIGQ